MKNAIHIINTYIKMLLLRPTNSAEIIGYLHHELNGLKMMLIQHHDHNVKPSLFKREFNYIFFKLTELSNTLYRKKTNNNAIKEAFILINQSIEDLQKRYQNLISDHQGLAKFKYEVLKKLTKSHLPQFEKQLLAKKVNKDLVYQLIKAITDLLIEGRYPSLSYTQENYLLIILPQLKQLSEDQRNKDWERKLKQFLIKYNFNYMGIYKLLVEERKSKLSQIIDLSKLLDHLNELHLWLSQIQEIPNLAYQPKTDSLKIMLIKELILQKSFLKEKIQLDQQNPISKLDCNASVHELCLLFHYHFEEGLFNYKTKKEAAEALSQHLKSKAMQDISVHSLIKFDKLQLNNAALKLYQRYKRIQDKLIKDFDL